MVRGQLVISLTETIMTIATAVSSQYSFPLDRYAVGSGT